MIGFMELEYKADINFSTSGDQTVIAAPGDGHYLAIDFISLLPTTATTIQFKDGATNYGGAFPLTAQQAITFDNAAQTQYGVITCSNNSAFVINNSGAVQVGGFIRYRIVGN